MSLDIAEARTAEQIAHSQQRFLDYQEEQKVPARVIAVRCPCLKLVRLRHAYRCLYCDIFFCKECAEQHFGKTVEEYKQERSELLELD
jgi:hypothetical protein